MRIVTRFRTRGSRLHKSKTVFQRKNVSSRCLNDGNASAGTIRSDPYKGIRCTSPFIESDSKNGILPKTAKDLASRHDGLVVKVRRFRKGGKSGKEGQHSENRPRMSDRNLILCTLKFPGRMANVSSIGHRQNASCNKLRVSSRVDHVKCVLVVSAWYERGSGAIHNSLSDVDKKAVAHLIVSHPTGSTTSNKENGVGGTRRIRCRLGKRFFDRVKARKPSQLSYSSMCNVELILISLI
ncbi:hypothetical protein RSAG8_06905, partial [Rhizoctonia solani AG-8 WAC10335]